MLTQPLRGLLPAGTVLGERYRVERYIATGGFGDVYAARHLLLENRVALKVLRVERLLAQESARHITAFLEEARMLARLRHPGIVSVLDAGVVASSDQPYIALEWAEGQSLRDVVGADPRPMGSHQAWALLRPVADALAHAHAQGVIHRDVKPSNLMLVREGAVTTTKLLDFGIAKLVSHEALDVEASRTRGALAGFTPAYAAPEQVTGSPTGPWTDIHALALVFVELVTGRAPYRSDIPLESAMASERPSLKGVAHEPALDAVVACALARDPRARYRDVPSLVRALEVALSGGAVSAAGASERPADPHSYVAAREVQRPLMSSAPPAALHLALETAPTSSAMVREAATYRAAPKKGRGPLVFGLVALGATALALTAAGAWFARPYLFPEPERRDAHRPSSAPTQGDPHTPSASPSSAAPSATPTASPTASAAATGVLHRDRRFASLTMSDLDGRLLGAGLSISDSQEKTDRAGSESYTQIVVQGTRTQAPDGAPAPNGGVDCSFSVVILSRASDASAEKWASGNAAVMTDWYYAIEGNHVLQISALRAPRAERYPECERAVIEAVAPRR